MSVTICSEIVEINALIPRAVHHECEVFQNTDVVGQNEECDIDWPRSDSKLRSLFHELGDYSSDLSDAFKARKSIKLPRKNRQLPERKPFSSFMQLQSSILKTPMTTLYYNRKGIREHSPQVKFKSEMIQKYTIGCQQFSCKSEGAAIVMCQGKPVPIIFFTGWFEGQTWYQFLMEILSIMLGKLARNITLQRPQHNARLHDQEVFVVGFYGFYFHIAY
ncbi:hypothetical protein BO78DRAFT_417063 [Aspergillus sclerotiicarbonarius CBS 121057]|uniref:Uncharacterized protein n=1 Tax=Aspergillus sclerotiicarbonarius (strain CBS 121057 / IBT 28362) TaxID=1448318 RepID=A0A319EK69_ASPSB|nr:hypothetical protein BO78DRAFT_417063 [Aspergillus sclerotiicarbonarius CBS 121057]